MKLCRYIYSLVLMGIIIYYTFNATYDDIVDICKIAIGILIAIGIIRPTLGKETKDDVENGELFKR